MRPMFGWILALMVIGGLYVMKQPNHEASIPSPQAPPPKTSAALHRKAFQPATAGYGYRFPRDHAAHPAFKTEWWYYTGHLTPPKGELYGFELTFFRSATGLFHLPTGTQWQVPELYAAHFTITDPTAKRFLVAEKLGRPHPDRALARRDRYEVFLNDWSVRQQADGSFRLKAAMPKAALSLQLTSQKPPSIHGHNGISQKAPCAGCASHYYSLTRLTGAGTLTLSDKRLPVNAVAWMDHEFGSNQLTGEQTGWDWFSVQLDDQQELMLYLLRRKDGTVEPTSSGSWVDANGQVTHLPLGSFQVEPLRYWTSPVTRGRYPMGWQIRLPQRGLVLTVRPVLDHQELVLDDKTGVSYWEGACVVKGNVAKGRKPVSGRAYVEMTGYAKPFNQKI